MQYLKKIFYSKKKFLHWLSVLPNVQIQKSAYLVVFFGDFCRYTLALIAVLMTTGTVSTTTLNQKTQWPENGVSSLQLLPQ